ncbi:MAG: hypothetical protein JZU65_22650 [Chlorobium sp.]|nr:hypothetical protein [Chlorobium sp.]
MKRFNQSMANINDDKRLGRKLRNDLREMGTRPATSADWLIFIGCIGLSVILWALK